MRMNKKKEIVPKFRFPKSEQWISTELSSLLDYERPDLYIVESDNYKNEGIPVLTANKSFILGYTDEKNNIYSCVPVIIFDDFTTEKKYVDFPFKVKSSAIKILKPKGNNVLKFVFELMNTINFEAKEHKRYYISTYQKLFVCAPKDVKEQQKIADCLSSIDDLIDAESRKLRALEKYKKGLIQKLFPAEGKTLPEWRFPEFQGCGEWKLQKLKLICDFQEGYAFSSSDFVTNDTDSNYIQVVRITDINNKNSNTDKVFVNMDLIKRDDLYKYLISKNDLILSLTGAAGFNFFIWNTNIAVLNQRTLKLIPKDEKNHAIKFLIEPLIHKEINMHGTGQNNNLSKEVLKNVEIVLPTSFKEQQKIADCLSEIDKIITEQSNKVEQLKAHKKGLMQGLFPSLEEADE